MLGRLLTPVDGVPFTFISPVFAHLRNENCVFRNALKEIFEIALRTDGMEEIAIIAAWGLDVENDEDA
jgi:hypothetical protein